VVIASTSESIDVKTEFDMAVFDFEVGIDPHGILADIHFAVRGLYFVDGAKGGHSVVS
jgi:hypothetical protein